TAGERKRQVLHVKRFKKGRNCIRVRGSSVFRELAGSSLIESLGESRAVEVPSSAVAAIVKLTDRIAKAREKLRQRPHRALTPSSSRAPRRSSRQFAIKTSSPEILPRTGTRTGGGRSAIFGAVGEGPYPAGSPEPAIIMDAGEATPEERIPINHESLLARSASFKEELC